MADEKNPFEAIQALMLDNLEKMQGGTQSYIDMFGKPGANQDAIVNFKAYLERQVAANCDFVEKLLRARTSRKLSASKANTFSLN
jgi:hypothetical protein